MNKEITLSSVKFAALLLIDTNGTTTTLELKGLLRDIGYHVTQNELSKLVEQAADELPLSYISGTKYRTYSMPDIKSVMTSNEPSEPTTAAATDRKKSERNIVSHIKRDGSIIIGSKLALAATSNDWCVTDGINDPIFFAHGHTRDIVRSAYSNINNVPFHSTRSSRVK